MSKENVGTPKKYLLIDLDGTLINTANGSFALMKDGKEEVDVEKIELFNYAQDFLIQASERGFENIIISDSHPRYVAPIVDHFFEGTPFLSLADKPNTLNTLNFLEEIEVYPEHNSCYFIGDSWLDIELGRGLQIPTILTDFYTASNIEIRDGIGDYSKNVRSGPTYYTKSYSDILAILDAPLENLLSIESIFQSSKSFIARRPCADQTGDRLSLHRFLARQVQGECDDYHVTPKYFELSRSDRSPIFLNTVRDAVITYLEKVLMHQKYIWDILTYVPDKATTQPPDKMAQLFYLIADQIGHKVSNLHCTNIFEWNSEVSSSTRSQPTAADRRVFVDGNLGLMSNIDVNGQSIIILDDQYTTGATAKALTEQLQSRGAKNVLFIAMFYLISPVNSRKLCPRCLERGTRKNLQIKINRSDGSKFYSCVPPQYRGNGCGYRENIE